MSLFKSREWWYVHAGAGEDYDACNICIGNVDNSPDGLEKIIVGSLQGILRIYCPQTKGGNHEDMMLEYQTDSPILGVDIGRLVGDSGVYLAILHPRKVVVCSVSVDTTTKDTGTFYNVSQVYSHKLERTACNMCLGSFGSVKNKDFICVQSMDGMLSFYEQDSFAFARFLPQFLIPGPLCYVPSTDTFITSSSSNFVEAYRYQTLAVSTESESKDQIKTGAGKRLRVDWKTNIGDNVVDVKIFNCADDNATTIFVLGEHNLFALRENGVIRYMKKFDFNPSCFAPYASLSEGTVNMLVANYCRTCYVWQDTTLAWSSSFQHVPVFIGVLSVGQLRGHIVTLDETGKIYVSYLGTDPSLQTATPAENREINYDEKDQEMAKLQQVIRDCTKPIEHAPKVTDQPDFSIFVDPVNGLDIVGVKHEESDTEYPTVTVKINLRCSSKISLDKVTLTVAPEVPFYATQRSVVLTNVGSGPTSLATFSIYNTGQRVASDLVVPLVAHYTNNHNSPRSVHNSVQLPLQLVVTATCPEKTAAHKITIETNKPAVNLLELFSEMNCEAEGGQNGCVAFKCASGEIVTLLAAKNSQKYRIQSNSFLALYIVIKQFLTKLRRHFEKIGGPQPLSITFPGPVPLQEYFDIIDSRFELRVRQRSYREMLSQRAQQFRAIQRRLLTRFKDKTPSPLQNMDTLLEGTYQQILALADVDLQTTKALEEADHALSTATKLLLLLVKLWCPALDDKQSAVLQSCLTPDVNSADDVGWEEMVDASITMLLRTCLAKTTKEQSVVAASLKLPSDTTKLKKHIALLLERLNKGGTLSLNTFSEKQSQRNKEQVDSGS
ncbi:protein PTHB1-like isoform X3 [Bolinopsis microptera]|uniref:protein PTHB1-like isoform X3 n=1 Tax=Bolinopsis microptera TaxID=2820187 RepID=UPI00307AF2AD